MDQIYIKNNKSFWKRNKRNRVHNEPKPEPPKKVTFQESMRTCLIINQVLSVIPVVGVSSRNTSDVRFTKTSVKFYYSLLIIMGNYFVTALRLYNLTQYGDDIFNSSIAQLFDTTICWVLVILFQVARDWPALVRSIARIEDLDPIFDSKLAIKSNVTCAVVTLMAIFEYFMLHSVFFQAIKPHCESCDSFQSYIMLLYPRIFNVLPYSHIFGIFILFLHCQHVLIWNCTDMLLFCISYYLISRFEQINRKLEAAEGKYLPEIFWRSTREEYTRTTDLVRKVDDVICGVLFVSLAYNLSFICLQLFYTLRDIHITEFRDVYLFFSLGFVIVKTTAVFLVTSQVHTVSTVPASVLYAVPSPAYCDEVQIFLLQVKSQKVALSGLKLFYMTRELFLTIVGTIITYELVLFQLNSAISHSNSTNSLFLNMTNAY